MFVCVFVCVYVSVSVYMRAFEFTLAPFPSHPTCPPPPQAKTHDDLFADRSVSSDCFSAAFSLLSVEISDCSADDVGLWRSSGSCNGGAEMDQLTQEGGGEGWNERENTHTHACVCHSLTQHLGPLPLTHTHAHAHSLFLCDFLLREFHKGEGATHKSEFRPVLLRRG